MAKVAPIMYGDRKVYTVAAFNSGVARYLRRLPDVWVEGELTELRRNEAWATVFLTLKDQKTGAILGATIARRAFDRLELALAEGETVHVHGRAELYEAKGEFLLRADAVERLGVGDHLVALERLKQKLAAEGLFAAERKRPLPRIPRAVGILTGADAAARGDLVRTIADRFPAVRLVICETRVQGRGAPERIVSALHALASRDDVDVVVLTRGGGSLEDLLPFSDESVVRAVAACPVPVVSAVGHEQDTPLCDLSADARAATPTAAGTLVVPSASELRAALDGRRERIAAAVRRIVARDRERLVRRHERLGTAVRSVVERRRIALDRAAERLQALSPLATLERGYAIVRHEGGALREAQAIAVGARIEVQLARGALDATVDEVRP